MGWVWWQAFRARSPPSGGREYGLPQCVRVCILPRNNAAEKALLCGRYTARTHTHTPQEIGRGIPFLLPGRGNLGHQESEVYSDFRLLVAQGPTRSVRAPEDPATQSRVYRGKNGETSSHTRARRAWQPRRA